jgi:ribosomal protein S18 acetylase RimI-like enzyme
MNITIRTCTQDDVFTLKDISYKIFSDTFSEHNSPSVLKAYLDYAYDAKKLLGELRNKESAFYFIYADDNLAGYLKLNEYPAQTEINDPVSLEIERIYVKNEYQGQGIGQRLIDKAVEVALQRQKTYVWLGVWERNEKAQRFYIKNGFYRIGEHSFLMGSEEQTDHLLRKDLI